MRKILVLLSLFLGWHAGKAQQQQQMYPTVLVELFSSEGCSSCPLADAFLKEMMGLADSNQVPIFFLDYHVDIWNQSGWVDKFSDTSFSRRQREYMVKTKQQALFTPMMFVNGGGALPGSAKKEVGQLINKNMNAEPQTQLMTRAGYVAASNTLILNYEIVGKMDSCNLNLVLAYKEVKSDITGGENKGQLLTHHHTVKKWKWFPIDPSKKGKIEMELPYDVKLSDLMLISFVQQEATWKVLATDQLMFR
ncbi:MAG: DUF1223 domain-containing protein [Bacteroidota bacterium]